MFREIISSTPFVGSQEDSFFRKITGESYGADCTMVSTLRALVYPRMGNDDFISVSYRTISKSAEDIKEFNERGIVESILHYVGVGAGKLIIYNLCRDHETNIVVMDALGKAVKKELPDFQRLDGIKAFYKKSFSVDCFVNPHKKTTLLFVDLLSYRKLHYLQASILAFMPWYLDKERGITDEEMELIKSLREATPDKYLQCLSNMVEKYDFRGARIRELLDGFEIRMEKMELEEVVSKINGTDDEIRHHNEAIGQLIKRRNDLCIRHLGLERKIEEGSGESEIMEYFLHNKHVVLENCADDDMRFGVKTYLDYFDPDIADSMIGNRQGSIYGYHHNDKVADKVERLMREVFLSDTPRIRIRICAAYRLVMNGCVHGLREFAFGSEYDGYIPNMHIQAHACMSSYECAVNEFLLKRDYIGAIEQCVASAKSLDFGDNVVLKEFMDKLWGEYYDDKKCFELPDGSVVSMKAAYEWLEQEDKPKKNEKKKGGAENE